MDYQQAFIDLVAYCQRNDLLGTTGAVYRELADILTEELTVDEIREALE